MSGSGSLTKSGPGTVTLGTQRAVTRYDRRGWRHLSLDALPSGAWTLNRGTLAYTGAAASFAQPVTIDSGTRAVILRTESDLTLSGGVTTQSGALLKTGAGILTLVGPASNTLGLGSAANLNGIAAAGVDGDGPTVGFGAFNVAQGCVKLGDTDQRTVIGGPLFVGLATTANANSETWASWW